MRTAAGIAALLVGASGAAPPRTPLSPERTAAAFDARSLEDPGLGDMAARAGFPAWPPARLDGRALTLVAIRNGEAVRLARAKWRVAEAAVRAAGERPNPSLSSSPLFVTNAAAGVSPWMISAELVQLIDTAVLNLLVLPGLAPRFGRFGPQAPERGLVTEPA